MENYVSDDSRCNQLSNVKKGLVSTLKETVLVEYGEPVDYLDDSMCRRYLAGYKWSLESARLRLLKTLRWRAAEKPETWQCHFCHDAVGLHSMRQIGFDRFGRSVLYTSFVQNASSSFSAEESVRHMVYLLENGVRAMQHRHRSQDRQPVALDEEAAAANARSSAAAAAADDSASVASVASLPGQHQPEQWVVVLDCTGMSLSACNPRIAMAVTAIIGDHYPERLGTIVALNAGYLMRYAWAAIEVVLPATMAAKLKFVASEADYKTAPLSDLFDDELRTWVQDEERLNRTQPLAAAQRQFWKRPSPELQGENDGPRHDPRGTPSYVSDYLDTFDVELHRGDAVTHQPHPNAITELAAK